MKSKIKGKKRICRQSVGRKKGRFLYGRRLFPYHDSNGSNDYQHDNEDGFPPGIGSRMECCSLQQKKKKSLGAGAIDGRTDEIGRLYKGKLEPDGFWNLSVPLHRNASGRNLCSKVGKYQYTRRISNRKLYCSAIIHRTGKRKQQIHAVYYPT